MMRYTALALAVLLPALALGQTPGLGGETCAQYMRGFPEGGQANGAVNSLDQVGAFAQGTGPLESWVAGGSVATSTHSGTPGAPITLFLAPPATGFLLAGGQSLDVNIFDPSALAIYDGLGVLGPADGAAVSGNGTFTIPYAAPNGVTLMVASLQGANADAAAPFGITLTSRNDIGFQDAGAIAAGTAVPEMPPILLNIVTPIAATGGPRKCAPHGVAFEVVGPTTGIYPFPRDAICPNNGPVGTRHSAVGVNFDATANGATTATVNGVPVIVELVRPDEIIFQMTAAHEASIGGALIITTPAATYTPSADQIESWVWVTPTVMPDEGGLGVGFGAGGNGAGSGTLTVAGGLAGFTGTKDIQGQLDGYDITSVPANTPIKVFCGQWDPVGGQIVGGCSGLPPVTGTVATCNTTAAEAWNQQLFANAINCFNDTFLHIAPDIGGIPLLGPAQSAWGTPYDQDDGGPGTTSFMGMSQIPGSATNPALDPDTDHVTLVPEWIVVDDFGNAPFAGNPPGWPYDYILLVSF